MAQTFVLEVTEEHLNKAIEDYHTKGGRAFNCVIAQAARGKVKGFYSCGSMNITAYSGRWECDAMKEFTLNFDKELYDVVRGMLPAQLEFTHVGKMVMVMQSEIVFEDNTVTDVRPGLYIETRRFPGGDLLRSKRAIVMVNERGAGVVVAVEDGHTTYDIGYHSEKWLITTCFKPFHGTIKITS